MDLVEISRRLENIVRIGSVHSIDHAAVRCRVQSGGLVTQWLPWIESRAGETTTWSPPTVGEQCIVFSPSGEAGGGIVLYGIHSSGKQPPSHAPEKHVIKFPDGAAISYDHAASHLEASGIQTCSIEAGTSITLDTPMTRITGKCVIDDLLTYGNGISGTGGGNGHMISGDFTHAEGSLSSNGIVLHTHTHPGTGGPQ